MHITFAVAAVSGGRWRSRAVYCVRQRRPDTESRHLHLRDISRRVDAGVPEAQPKVPGDHVQGTGNVKHVRSGVRVWHRG